MSPEIVVIAGLDVLSFDRIGKISANRLAPRGILILHPFMNEEDVYLGHYIDALLRKTFEAVRKLPEMQKISVQLVYVQREHQGTAALRKRFFPFSLPAGISPPNIVANDNRRVINEKLNLFAEQVIGITRNLRRLAQIVKGNTDVAKLTPLLLPLTNFRSEALISLLSSLFEGLAESEHPQELCASEIRRFLATHPRRKAGTDARHCFSDGYLFFKSPGRDRHGYFKLSAGNDHRPECLLNARSRLGGAYDYTFHYDCTPTRGALAASYTNCHGRPVPPKKTHVNIAPNDYVI